MDDRVALVALNPLQVLNEERLGLVFGEERLELRGPCQLTPQRRVNPLGMLDTERDHAERLARPRPGMFTDQLDHLLDLGGGPRLPSWVPRLLGHHMAGA